MTDHLSSNDDDWADAEDADAHGAVGGLDLSSLFGMANEMLAAQQAAADEIVVGSAGGGAVEVRVTGGGEFTAVRLAPETVDPSDVSMLEDLILAALHDAMTKVQQLQGGALGGMDLGGLGGLLGGMGGGALGEPGQLGEG